MSTPLGTEMTVCRNIGDFASPSWSNLRGLGDVKLDIQPAAMVKSSDRATNVDTEIPTRFKLACDLTLMPNGSDGHIALRNAFINGTPIELAVLYGAAGTGKRGVRAEWAVTSYPLDFPLADSQKISIKLQPHADWTNEPSFYTDATGSAGALDTIVKRLMGGQAAVYLGDLTQITKAMDIKLGLQPGNVAAVDDRDTLFDCVRPARLKMEPEFTFLWNPAVAPLLSLYTAATTNAPIELFILDGPHGTSGTWGVHSDWAINGFPVDGKLKDGQMVTVKLTPHGDGTVAPVIYTA